MGATACARISSSAFWPRLTIAAVSVSVLCLGAPKPLPAVLAASSASSSGEACATGLPERRDGRRVAGRRSADDAGASNANTTRLRSRMFAPWSVGLHPPSLSQRVPVPGKAMRLEARRAGGGPLLGLQGHAASDSRRGRGHCGHGRAPSGSASSHRRSTRWGGRISPAWGAYRMWPGGAARRPGVCRRSRPGQHTSCGGHSGPFPN